MHRLSYLCLFTLSINHLCNAKSPHVIFIVADDLGWNDISWHNPSIYTPNLERLAREGVILDQSYVQPTCTPSRVAFMTGYYPYRTGRQNFPLRPLQPTGVSLNFTLLPQRLKSIGYSTHIVGKWHLGYCDWPYTPTYRGFDSFFGFYTGGEGYYNHTLTVRDRLSKADATYPFYLDFRNDSLPSRNYNGTYSAVSNALLKAIPFVYTDVRLAIRDLFPQEVFANAAIRILSTSNPNKPLFLYLPFQSVHFPVEVPFEWEKKYSFIKDANRRIYCGMVSALDDAVGKVISGLKKYGYWGNTVIIFTSDNGGHVTGGGNNWPLRGSKGTVWEGGTRGVAFVHSKLLKKKGYVNNKLFHAVDWYPTILQLAGAGNEGSSMDGVGQWQVISEDAPAARSEFIYNVYDNRTRRAAIRVGDFKLIWGYPGTPSGWIPPPEQEIEANATTYETSSGIKPTTLRLYNIRDDPSERENLATHLPQVTELLKKKIITYSEKMVPADEPDNEPYGDPSYWGGVFSPGWCVVY